MGKNMKNSNDLYVAKLNGNHQITTVFFHEIQFYNILYNYVTKIMNISNISLNSNYGTYRRVLPLEHRTLNLHLTQIHARVFTLTPLKINMEHNHGGLEDHVPFLMGDL